MFPDLPLFNASDKRAKYSAKKRAKGKKESKPKKKV